VAARRSREVIPITNDEIAGRLVVLEVFVVTAFGLYLSNSRNDPDFSRRRLCSTTRARPFPPLRPLYHLKRNPQRMNMLITCCLFWPTRDQ
jgi:hypothetical protein